MGSREQGWALIALAISVVGCRVDPECFRADECAAGLICVDRVCRPTSGRDASSEPTDGSEPADSGDAGVVHDSGADAGPDGGPPDGGQDGGPLDGGPLDGGCPTVSPTGRPLDDEQAPFLDLLLLHFDEGAGSVPEASNATGLPGLATCAAGSGCPQPGVCGVFDTAYRFSGEPLSTDQPVFFREADGSYGFEAWVRHTGTSTGCVFQVVDDQNRPSELTVCVAPNGAPFIANPARPMGDPTPRSQWQHVGVRRRDFGVAEIYQNGVMTGSAELVDRAPFISARLVIGGDADLARDWQFEGDIDELRLAARELDPTDFSILRPEAYLVWEVAEMIWVANENGFDARMLLGDGRMPRLSPRLSPVAFTRCSPGCNTWVANREFGVERQLTTSGQQDFNVPVAFDRSGDRIYFVQREPCGSNIRRTSVANGGDGDFIRRIDGRHIVGFDVGPSPGGGPEDMLLLSTESCQGPYQSRVERLVNPDDTGAPLETILTSTTADLTHGHVRINPYATDGSFVYEERLRLPDGRTFVRAVRDTAVPGASQPDEVGFDVRFPTFAIRPGWFVMTSASPNVGDGTELLLYDDATGGAAGRFLTSRTPTITENIHPDVRARFD